MGARGATAVVAMLIAGAVPPVWEAAVAHADSAPTVVSASNPVTLSADALPTVQINGVVWSQAVIGNTVYATGQFTRARPAGAAAGTNETVRNNILAFDIRTGNLITSFAPSLNGVGETITASPDGQRLYVGGSFTQVNGQQRNRIAALTPAGDLVAGWSPNVNGKVSAIAATNSTVFFGGAFSAVGGQARQRLASVSASTGALSSWAPVPGIGPTDGNRDGNTATSNNVLAMVIAGPNGQVVAAGRFHTMNGTRATGVAALDPTTGANRPFAVNQVITNQGVNSAIWSLSTDGTNVYGSGYDYFGPGDVEGTFMAKADGGQLVLINECRGDTYSTFPMNGVLYTAGHSHNCQQIGGVLEQNPRVEKRALAFLTTPVTRVRWPGDGKYQVWAGQPAGAQLHWYPDVTAGTFTASEQGGWSVVGNGQYLSYAGEFPRVNATAQQGIVRFAMPNVAGVPNRRGPTSSNFTASVENSAPGVARISWNETWDYDNEVLTYRVYRDSDTAPPIYTTTRASRWFSLERVGFSDYGQSGTHQYRVRATDAFGNTTLTPWVSANISAGNTALRPYAQVIRDDGAIDHWQLGESSGTGYSHTSGNDLTVGAGVTRGVGGAIVGDSNTAFNFNGASSNATGSQRAVQSPNVFTIEAWFRTTAGSPGKILGFGNAATGTSTTYDRHIYMDASGRVLFGVTHTNQRRTIQSATGFNDGEYHHVAATLGPNGMELYLDGVRVAQRADVDFGPNYLGYWRIGGDATWSGASWFNGRIDEVAVYQKVLSPQRIAAHRAIGLGADPGDFPPDGETTTTTSTTTTSTTSSTTTSTTTTTVPTTSSTTTTPSTTSSTTSTSTTTTTTTLPPAGGVVVASDGFTRELASGLGSADVGGAWTLSSAATAYSVSGGAGRIRMANAGNGPSAYLNSVSARNVNILVDVSLDKVPTGNAQYMSVIGRRSGTNDYRARIKYLAGGAVQLQLTRMTNGAETTLRTVDVPGITAAAGDVLRLRFEVTGTGTSTLNAKVWRAGAAEPASWQASITDAGAAQDVAGGVGLMAYLSGTVTNAPIVATVDNLTVVATG